MLVKRIVPAAVRAWESQDKDADASQCIRPTGLVRLGRVADRLHGIFLRDEAKIIPVLPFGHSIDEPAHLG